MSLASRSRNNPQVAPGTGDSSGSAPYRPGCRSPVSPRVRILPAPDNMKQTRFEDASAENDHHKKKSTRRRRFHQPRPKSADWSADLGCISSSPELQCLWRSRPSSGTPSDSSGEGTTTTTCFLTLPENDDPRHESDNDLRSGHSSRRSFFSQWFSWRPKSVSGGDGHRRSSTEKESLLGSGNDVVEEAPPPQAVLSLGNDTSTGSAGLKVPGNDTSSAVLKVPGNDTSTGSAGLKVPIRRYRSLSPGSSSPSRVQLQPSSDCSVCTPPMAIFSSDEDISSVPRSSGKSKAETKLTKNKSERKVCDRIATSDDKIRTRSTGTSKKSSRAQLHLSRQTKDTSIPRVVLYPSICKDGENGKPTTTKSSTSAVTLPRCSKDTKNVAPFQKQSHAYLELDHKLDSTHSSSSSASAKSLTTTTGPAINNLQESVASFTRTIPRYSIRKHYTVDLTQLANRNHVVAKPQTENISTSSVDIQHLKSLKPVSRICHELEQKRTQSHEVITASILHTKHKKHQGTLPAIVIPENTDEGNRRGLPIETVSIAGQTKTRTVVTSAASTEKSRTALTDKTLTLCWHLPCAARTDRNTGSDDISVSINSKGKPESASVPRSPRRNLKNRWVRDRPKSECILSGGESLLPAPATEPEDPPPSSSTGDVVHRQTRGKLKDRPKSDLGGCRDLSSTLQGLLRRDRTPSSSSLHTASSARGSSLTASHHSLHGRRMSTPQPIKSRSTMVIAPGSRGRLQRGARKKSRSAPDILMVVESEDTSSRRKTRHRDVFRMSKSSAGDLAVQPHDLSSESDSEDAVSLGAASISGSHGKHYSTLRDEILEDSQYPAYAEALWDHITMDDEELPFRAADVIEISQMDNRDWWFGRLEDSEGWFPANFVRLRVNQQEVELEEETSILQQPHMSRKWSLSHTQARTNVVREIVNAERDYVRHLKDVVKGYVEKCAKRPQMFTSETLSAIFGNITKIYNFSCVFQKEMEGLVDPKQPHLAELGQVFIKHRRGFEIYSEYCNNHPLAQEELRELQKNKKYTHFFEACRLLQDMIELPLEGFLLGPVQKICKYPLQLKELLKYTPPSHPDRQKIVTALDTMKGIAMMINERKRKMESLEKLSVWQQRIEDWRGPDLIENSSELIFVGDLTKVNNTGWHQERRFFLFDHQLIYCKKDMLWRDLLIYKGRIDLDHKIVEALPDGKDPVYNVYVKNAFRIYDKTKSRWFMLYCRSLEERGRWFRALQDERSRIDQDKRNSFNLQEFRAKLKARPPDPSRKQKKHAHPPKEMKKTPTRPPSSPLPDTAADAHNKRWFPFGQKKHNKR